MDTHKSTESAVRAHLILNISYEILHIDGAKIINGYLKLQIDGAKRSCPKNFRLSRENQGVKESALLYLAVKPSSTRF